MSEARRKASIIDQFVAAWPIVLLLYGGALGGVVGAVAWAINLDFVTRDWSAPIRYGLVLTTGLAAAALYVGVVVILRAIFPNLFAG